MALHRARSCGPSLQDGVRRRQSEASKKEKLAALVRSAKFYPVWYTSRWIGTGQLKSYSELAGSHRTWVT